MKDKYLNHLFSDRYHYYGSYDTPAQITLTSYDEKGIVIRELDIETEDFSEFLTDQRMHWLDVTGLTDTDLIYRIIDTFGLDHIDAKGILTPFHAAKIDENTKRLMIVLRSCLYESNGAVTSEHICIISRANIVLTFTERDTTKFDHIREAIRADTMQLRTFGRGMLTAFILNGIFSEIIGTAVKVENMLEKIDNILIDASHSNWDVGRRIEDCRHANLIIQKNSIPLRYEFSKLQKTELVRKNETLQTVYNELYNQLDFIILTSANSRELLASMRDLYASNNDLRINTVMRRLTVVSTLFIPITFLVGLWGMNFKLMPETDWKYGYVLAWIMIVLTVLFTWGYMKRNKWF